MTPALVWFTFRDDAAALLQSLRAARHWAPQARRIVIQDAAAPLPAEARERCIQAGAEVHDDTADRRGNLNGIENLYNQFRWLDHVQQAEEWLIKIDSDTLLNSPPESWLSTAAAGHRAVCAVNPVWWFQGPCYALRAGVPRVLRDGLADSLRVLDALAPKYPEDVCTGHLIAHHFGADAIHARPGYSTTLFTGDQIAHYSFATWPDFGLYRPFHTLSFGDRLSLPKQMPEAVKRLTAGRVMADYLDTLNVPP